MRIWNNPNPDTWNELVKRPSKDSQELNQAVNEVIADVSANGDEALFRLTEKFDGAVLDQLLVSKSEFDKAEIDIELADAINVAKANIERFHQSQVINEAIIETTSGVKCWRKSVGIEKVGLYIPGGSAPLFSTVLMLGIPAKLAGCKEIILCSPPDGSGQIHPAILFTAKLVGIDKVFKLGGAQAVAAMALGSGSIPKVDKIFGPGNQYVTKAKELMQQHGVAIDMPAGPSEVLVIADDSCEPAFVAADLLSQAEHGADSQVVLVSTNNSIVEEIAKCVKQQLNELPRKAVAEQALQNSFAAIFKSLDQCIAFSNAYAPEHLILNTRDNQYLAGKVVNAGSVFLGNYSCESLGDYASGTNHTLPTNGFARAYSGVSVDSFVKKITFQEVTPEGIMNIGPAVERMAAAEALYAHKNAVSLRLKALNNA